LLVFLAFVLVLALALLVTTPRYSDGRSMLAAMAVNDAERQMIAATWGRPKGVVQQQHDGNDHRQINNIIACNSTRNQKEKTCKCK
jgi:hypothetical protein